MIVLDVEQGSQEWIDARLGIPTASQFHRIITPKTMKPSAASRTYMHELIAERLIGASLDPGVSEWMERGSEMEESAVSFYEMQTDTDTQRAGHILTDEWGAGCSPDRLVGDDGGLEIKCPSAAIHVSYLLSASAYYKTQIQGSLWVTGRKWWDFLSYNPVMPPALVRFYRDDEYIEKLAACVQDFNVRLSDAMGELELRGVKDNRHAVA